jgi:hypothetical protein
MLLFIVEEQLNAPPLDIVIVVIVTRDYFLPLFASQYITPIAINPTTPASPSDPTSATRFPTTSAGKNGTDPNTTCNTMPSSKNVNATSVRLDSNPLILSSIMFPPYE